MNCESYDPPLRFLVSSARFGDKKYLVDLGEHNGQGRCDCANFRCRLEPEILAGKTGQDYRCKHIKLAMIELAEAMIRVTLRKERV